MSLLTALLRRPAPRHYVLLDDQRRCRMLLTSIAPPHGDRWVEVDEICLGMIGQSLPHTAYPTRCAPRT
ncbi:hypothetical protein [Pseudomonas sp. SST3]|uniref:hypothetical protein n=1 Tax=Pseudomonas sp. SST3 TaxID=2267882 RepID=UPI000E004C5D|nr:hypothetical protein [Pseudomonas sp. SST3]NKQ10310.1 hypothetical protein [Pseudomonas sp. SST3]